MERRRIIFTGRVQGVFFRATARDCARRHDVTGWVRNEPDGSVMLEIQGEGGEINAALDRLRLAKRGNIDQERTTFIDTDADERAFEIRA